MTYLYTCTDSSKQRFEVYYKAIKEIFHRKYTEEAFAFPKIIKLTIFMLSEIAEDDKDFQSGLNKVFGNPAFKASETEFTPDLYNNDVNMELTLDRGGDRPEFETVKNRLKNANGRSIGMANDNPILDSIMYEVK